MGNSAGNARGSVGELHSQVSLALAFSFNIPGTRYIPRLGRESPELLEWSLNRTLILRIIRGQITSVDARMF